jgi:hypothetical protein
MALLAHPPLSTTPLKGCRPWSTDDVHGTVVDGDQRRLWADHA